jgi:hypothetical protein
MRCQTGARFGWLMGRAGQSVRAPCFFAAARSRSPESFLSQSLPAAGAGAILRDRARVCNHRPMAELVKSQPRRLIVSRRHSRSAGHGIQDARPPRSGTFPPRHMGKSGAQYRPVSPGGTRSLHELLTDFSAESGRRNAHRRRITAIQRTTARFPSPASLSAITRQRTVDR